MEKPWLVVLPTYEEVENLEECCRRILALDLPLEILVVDDDSPDGTALLASSLSEKDPRIHVLVRREERGRGRAGAAGFAWALREGYAGAVEMDADLSHPPEDLPRLLAAAARGADLVLGSRSVPGGADLGRSLRRRLVTRAANAYVRRVFGIEVRDCNSGYRAWTRRALLEVDAPGARRLGPAIVQELLWRAKRAGLAVREVPIRFVERRRGRSTLRFRTLLAGLLEVPRLRFLDRWRPGTRPSWSEGDPLPGGRVIEIRGGSRRNDRRGASPRRRGGRRPA